MEAVSHGGSWSGVPTVVVHEARVAPAAARNESFVQLPEAMLAEDAGCAVGSATVRLLLAVLGSNACSRPPTRWSVRRTVTTRPFKPTSSHVRPRASP